MNQQIQSSPSMKTYHQYFRYFWGQSLSLIGSSIVQFAITWWITAETSDPSTIGLAYALAFIPTLIAMPISGVLADQKDRKKLILLADGAQATCTGLLIFYFFFTQPNIAFIIGINAIRAFFQGIHSPVSNAIIAHMVPEVKLNRINGYRQAVSGMIAIFSPTIAALFMMWLPINLILWLDVLTFSIALIPLLKMQIPNDNTEHNNSFKIENSKYFSQVSAFFHDLKAGFCKILQIKPILILILFISVFNLIYTPIVALLPFYVFSELNGSEQLYAWILLAINIGSVIGGLFYSHWQGQLSITRKFLYATLGMFLGLAGFTWLPYSWNFGKLASLFMHGIMLSILSGAYYEIFQLTFERKIQGRIFSIESFLTYVIVPIGSSLGGILSELLGIQKLFTILVLIGLILTIFFSFSNWKNVPFNKIDIEKQQSPIEVQKLQSLELSTTNVEILND